MKMMELLQSSRMVSTVTQGALARLATLGFVVERRWRSQKNQRLRRVNVVRLCDDEDAPVAA
jgi:hypothetical protein